VTRFLLLYRSVLGKKAIVAVTGAMMLGFLLLHVIGNLKAFLPDASPGVPDIDVYAEFLRTMGEPILPYSVALWIVRGILLAAIGLHVVCVFQLATYNRRARPAHYAEFDPVQTTRPARWMLYTGSLLLLFLIFHLLQFTTGDVDAARFVPGAVYGNLYRAFHEWTYATGYLVAMGVLALHLYHGGWSLFQSLGLDNPDRNRGLRRLALAVSVGLALAFASVPAAFITGFMKSPPDAQHTAALGENR
jgi:succinate dehydrogenase / fumarate reductase cytochrome b subunit